jgi:archaellum biogenesis ATPase FlaH
MSKEYTADLQKLFLEMMLHDAQNFVRVQNIYNVDNFDRSLHDTAVFIKQHSDDHGALPTHEQIKAVTGVELKPVPEITESHNDWFLAEFEGFTKRQELERAILKSADLLEKGEYEPVEKIIKDAVQISLTKDMGTNYFEDPRARLMALKDNNGQISTGWPAMDRKLFGGMNKGELNIFAGGSGSGKSLFMQNLAVNWVTQGLNGVYLSLELSEGLSAMRIDSMLTNVSTKEVFKDLDTVEMKVKMVGKKAGNLQIKYMPAQSNVNDVRAYLKELQIKNGWRVDFLLIDYLDLLMPVSAKVSPSDLFVKDKYVSEELRNLAKELNCVFVTASQLNRGAVDEIEFDHSHISGGLSKINTADNVFGIFTSRAMRERGRYQIQLMKTRSSSGVGQKIDLGFNLESLRITDLGEDEDAPQQTTGSNIMNRIKSNGVVEASDNVATPTASVQSSKLKDMLAGLKSE